MLLVNIFSFVQCAFIVFQLHCQMLASECQVASSCSGQVNESKAKGKRIFKSEERQCVLKNYFGEILNMLPFNLFFHFVSFMFVTFLIIYFCKSKRMD